MTPEEFRASAAGPAPPAGLSPALVGLWHDARGDWDTAHRVVQEASDRNSAWVHAYLHRKEGDLWNAGYWYSRAGRSQAGGSLAEEWAALAAALLVGEDPGRRAAPSSRGEANG
jgi:hypothetical protein